MLPSKRFILSSILPCIGCVWQLYYIITAYMSYNSLTEINRIYYGRYKPPILEFCVELDYSFMGESNGDFKSEDYPTARSRIKRLRSFQEGKVYFIIVNPYDINVKNYTNYFDCTQYYKDNY